MKRILITGSTGFLGKHFIKYIKENHSKSFVIYESNTKENNIITDLLKTDIRYDYIFHFAAFTKAGDWCLSHPGEQWLINQQINTNIIKYWINKCPNAKFVGIGTSCSYGRDCIRTEKNYLKYEPEPSLLTYAYTKRMLYLGLEAAAKQYNLNYLYLVPSTLYGTNFTDDDNHFIYDIIRKIHNAKKHNTNVEMWGLGSQRRELIWVNDFIELMFKIVFDNNHNNEIINITPSIDYSIQEYYDMVSNLLYFDKNKIIKNTEKYTGMYSNKLESSYSIVNNFQFKDIKQGLKEII